MGKRWRRGDILVQKAKGFEHILLVKAGKEQFQETNLSVITADGILYSFLVAYENNPSTLNLSFSINTDSSNALWSTPPQDNEVHVELFAAQIAQREQMLHGIKKKRYKMKVVLDGLYIKNNMLYFQLEVQNGSNISYDTEMFRFFIQDEKRARRTASQEIDIEPVFTYGNISKVKEGSRNTVVFAIPKFTIPDNKFLGIQLLEKNGDGI